MHSDPPRVNVLGVGISAINVEQALKTIGEWIEKRDPHYVCVCTVHTVMECHRDPDLRRLVNQAGLATPDGMPLVWIGRLSGYPHMDRVYGPDLMLALCKRSVDKGYRHYFYGGAEGVAEQLADALQRRFPGLQVVGGYSPPFRPLSGEEEATVVGKIVRASPDIVWVGLGTPKQDWWVGTHVGRVHAPVLIAVGAAFDFLTGRVKQAPRWVQRSGLEWLFRLSQEPGRLWRRYLLYNPLFLFLILLQWTGLRRYPLD